MVGRFRFVIGACGALGAWLVGGMGAQAADEATPAEPDYQSAIYSPLHFKPAIETATDAQCLACHENVLERQVLPEAPAGVAAADAFAWYQTLDTYEGDQATFHQRHRTTPYAQEVMALSCNFCHQGHDPREEAPIPPTNGDAGFTLRKVVDPSATCLRCHGVFPYEIMELPGPWHEVRQDLEFEEAPNGCLTCHNDLFRTVRHQVNYLKADAIEAAASAGSDVCYGCHGGRAWYRNSFPYARHPWPDMPEETPAWAEDRPTESESRFLVGVE